MGDDLLFTVAFKQRPIRVVPGIGLQTMPKGVLIIPPTSAPAANFRDSLTS